MFGRAAILVFAAALLSCRAPQPVGERFAVALKDPIHPNLPARTFDVFLTFDEQGFPVQYRIKKFTLGQLESLPDPSPAQYRKNRSTQPTYVSSVFGE